jgi:ectoine hydroxylase-related dioxygenase (phytanoyl-CoA dioxygenase family)
MTLLDANATLIPLELPRLKCANADAIEIALRRAGCVVVENAITPEKLAWVSDALDHWFDQALPGEGKFFGQKTKRFSGVFAKSEETIELALHAEILSAIENLLIGAAGAPNADCIQLSQTQGIEIMPGEPAQLLHRDDGVFPFAKTSELIVNVNWALDPFTISNGATRLLPGSHLWPRQEIEQYQDGLADAVAPAGSAVIWTGALLHGGGANRSNTSRRALVMSYSLGWLAQAEKLLLSIPPKLARTLPERLQRLIGYQLHRPNLGWVEGRDPIEWLHKCTGALAAAQDNLTPDQDALMQSYLCAIGR